MRALRPEDRAARQRVLDAVDLGRLGQDAGAEGEAVGAAFLHAINAEDRRARYAIGLYDPSFFGRGLGQQATRLVLQHAFETLMLHRVDLRVLDYNHRAIATYRACGFVEEGRERETCFLDGRWYDDVVMAVLEHEFAVARGGRRET